MSKYYVVWKGRKTGVFQTWAECEAQTKGFPGARFKSFPTLKEAKAALVGTSTPPKTNKKPTTIETNSISVDAACSGNPGMMEYRGVDTSTGVVRFHFGPILGTNNIGEFLAIVDALRLLGKTDDTMTIYTDSQTALAWVRNKKANTTLRRDKTTEQVWQLVEQAEQWLHTHSYKNPIIKWDTAALGEIKADFGRK